VARRAQLLARLAERLAGEGLLDAVPSPVAKHLRSELQLSRWRMAAMLWALERVQAVLHDASYPVVLLKGAAYVAQDLPIAKGRLPSDVDLLVPFEHLQDAQRRLWSAGWEEVELDAHAKRYYYEWSHEVPPMRHPLHAFEVDLHHNIVPPLGWARIDAGTLVQGSGACTWPFWKVLSPTDQVLHCATHLFDDYAARTRLRDLVDLDGLLRHFASSPSFWGELHDRARQLNLVRACALACHFTSSWLGTPIPAETFATLRSQQDSWPNGPLLRTLFSQVLMPVDPDRTTAVGPELSRRFLEARYHCRRMPLRHLLRHFWHKASVSRKSDPAATGYSRDA
jgi:hypothetical protein